MTILEQLADRPYVLNELERKINTNDQVLRRHLEELVTLGLVRLRQHDRHARNGQRYTTAELVPRLPQQSYESILQQKQHRQSLIGSEQSGKSDLAKPEQTQ